MRPVVIQPGEGKKLNAFGESVSVLLNGSDTGGSLALMLDTTPPGGGPPPHVHENEDEIFLVINGRIEYTADGVTTEVKPGGAVFLPRGLPHCYKNVGDDPSQHWIIATPAGFETFFERCSVEFANAQGPDMARIVDISREHGIEYLD